MDRRFERKMLKLIEEVAGGLGDLRDIVGMIKENQKGQKEMLKLLKNELKEHIDTTNFGLN